MSSIRTIFVPYDFSEYAEAALAVADGLAQQLEADLYLFHVVQPPLYLDASESWATCNEYVVGCFH